MNKNIIIIVDDDYEDQKLAILALQRHSSGNDFEIKAVSTPKDMVSFLKNPIIIKEYSPIILLDIKMPGVDGFDGLKMIKEDPTLKHIPIVILSSTSNIIDINKSYELGANSFMSKKMNLQDLINDMRIFKEYWIDTNKGPQEKI